MRHEPRCAAVVATLLVLAAGCSESDGSSCAGSRGNLFDRERSATWQFQGYYDHSLALWLPLGIAWVNSGNHSLTVGVLQGGCLPAEDAWDISRVYKYVNCDGRYFIRRHDGAGLAPVRRIESAALFEIGRLMVQHGVSA